MKVWPIALIGILCPSIVISSVERSLGNSGATMWRYKVTREGTHSHICLDGFRFIRSDTSYGIPIGVTATQTGTMYSQDSLNRVFNVNNNPGGDNTNHWCATGFTDIVVTFASPEQFSSYKFMPHSNDCTNDPQTWYVEAKNSGDATWTRLADENRNCPLPKQVYTQYSLTPYAGGGGDPHFFTFAGTLFSWQGVCDLVFLKSPSISNGDALEIHIRTRKVRHWSAIDSVALKMQQTVIEIRSTDEHLMLNGTALKSNQANPLIHTDTLKVVSGKHKKTLTYDFTFDEDKTMEAKVNLRTQMIYLTLSGNFSNETHGLLGAPQKPGLFDRDGNEMSPKNVNAFVESWQKNDKDPQLFEIARIPQYPSSCLYVMNEKPTNSRKLKERSKVKMEDAIRVCAVHSAGPMRQFCIDDVFATGDLDSATFEFYGSKH